MSLSLELQRYLKIRRNLGYDLSTSERVLKQFVSFLERKNETHITSDLFLEWRQVFGKTSESTWARRLSHITDIFNYSGMHMMAQKIRIPFMKKNFVEGQITDEFIKQLIVDQAQRLITF